MQDSNSLTWTEEQILSCYESGEIILIKLYRILEEVLELRCQPSISNGRRKPCKCLLQVCKSKYQEEWRCALNPHAWDMKESVAATTVRIILHPHGYPLMRVSPGKRVRSYKVPGHAFLACSNVNDIETKAKTLWYRSLLSERKQNVLIWSA